MKRLLPLFLLLLCCESNAQTHKVYLDVLMWYNLPKELDWSYKAFSEESSITLKDSLPDGKYLVYYDKAGKNLYLSGQFKNRLREGTWTYYHENGRIARELQYTNGLAQGNLVCFSYWGDTSMTAVIKNGKYEGASYLYDQQARLVYDVHRPWYMRQYDNDTITGARGYARSGQLTMDYETGRPQPKREAWYTEYGEKEMEAVGGNYQRFKDRSNATRYSMRIDLSNAQEVRLLDSLPECINLHSIHITCCADGKSQLVSDAVLFKKLEALKNLPRLDEVTLPFTDTLPPVIFELSQLRILSVSAYGNFPDDWSRLKTLELLELIGYSDCDASTKTKIRIPHGITSLPALRELKFHNVCLQNAEKDLPALATMSTLRSLDFWNTSMTAFPEALTPLKQLRCLSICGDDESSCNDKFNKLPASLAQMTNLRMLTLPEELSYESTAGLLSSWRKKLPDCEITAYTTCFTADVKVTMADRSEKSIATLQAGDRILCYNLSSKKIDTTTVRATHVHLHPSQPIEQFVSADGAAMNITPNHPVMNADGNFSPAQQFRSRSIVYRLSADGSALEQTTLETAAHSDLLLSHVYNLSTTKGTYFANGILVHNK